MADHDLVRPLREAGLSLYLPSEEGTTRVADDVHLVTATRLGAVLVSQNQRDFAPLHHIWQGEQRAHAGILLVRAGFDIGRKIALLERASRLLTPEAAHNQLMVLSLFATEEQGAAYAASLTSLR